MRLLIGRFVALTAMLLMAFALAQGATPAAVVASVAAVVLATAGAIRLTSVIVGSRQVSVGEQAHARHLIQLGMPAPQHPDTAGRPRTRAPSMVVATT
ncbi:MAG TPA: DUF6412 domain-containing protein [Rhodoglobus sp.]|nr:DUF6412 domain-containing protein [Rhodoglobus sp.]